MITLVCLSGPSYATGEKDLKVTVKKIADAIKKGDAAGAKKLATAAVKDKDLVDEMSDIMHMFRPRNKGGMGVGEKAGTNPAKDGLEIALRDLGRDVPASVAKQAEALKATQDQVAASESKGHGKRLAQRQHA